LLSRVAPEKSESKGRAKRAIKKIPGSVARSSVLWQGRENTRARLRRAYVYARLPDASRSLDTSMIELREPLRVLVSIARIVIQGAQLQAPGRAQRRTGDHCVELLAAQEVMR
jgi:hypothetical protein